MATHEGSHYDDEEPSVRALVMRRLRKPSLSAVKQFFGSVVTSLGNKAFFAISFLLSLVALIGQWLARRLRNADFSSGIPEFMDKLLERVRATTGKLSYQHVATKIFDVAGGNDHALDEAELYCLCLNLYCTTTQYMPQVLTPPTRAHTDALFRVFDIDHSGHLDREEFLLLASIFYENLLMRIAAQSAISLMLAPFVASHVVEACCLLRIDTFTFGSVDPATSAQRTTRFAFRKVDIAATIGSTRTSRTLADVAFDTLPPRLQDVLGSQTMATTCIAATLVACFVPFTLSLLDELYLLRAARRTRRGLVQRRSTRRDVAAVQLAVAAKTSHSKTE